MRRRSAPVPKKSKSARARVAAAGSLGIALSAALLIHLGIASESAATPNVAGAETLSLEALDSSHAGPICIRPASRPFQNLAGFSLAVGSILMLAPRRESGSARSEAGPNRR